MSDPNAVSPDGVAAGAAIYSKFVLRFYDLMVMGFNNPFAWQCPTRKLFDFYNQHVSGNHLEVGVGSGYYLDKSTFPVTKPRIALLDLNPNSLATTARRVRRYQPSTHQADVLQPVDLDVPGFDSISLYYLLHCLPGTMHSKSAVFANLKPLLNDGGVVFGSTILGEGQPFNFVGHRFMEAFNARGIFSNTQDNLEELEQGLDAHFAHYSTQVVGHVAFFEGRD